MALTDPTSQWLALSLVLDKLLEPIDIVRFGAVCKQWHTFAKTYFQTNPKRNHQKLLPLLIIPPPLESDEGNKTRRRIYSLSETKVYDNIHLSLPSYRKRYCGSCHGWLATVDDERLAITLHNPFQTAADPIRLPPLDFLDFQFTVLPHHKAKGLYEYYVSKVVLSADPILSPDDYVVAVLCGVYAKLAFIKKGQTSWTLVPAIDDDGDELYMKDLVFHRGKLYTVGDSGLMMAVDYNDHSNNNKAVTEGMILLPNKPFFFQSTRDYLVESTKGELFLLRRMIWYDRKLYRAPGCAEYALWYDLPLYDDEMPITLESFQICRVVLDQEDNNIVQHIPVRTIGDEAFFIGDNQPVYVLASNYPIEADCIYYTDDLTFKNFRPWGPNETKPPLRAEIGVFHLSEFTATPYKSLNIDWQLRNPPALWIVPSIN